MTAFRSPNSLVQVLEIGLPNIRGGTPELQDEAVGDLAQQHCYK